MFVLVDDGEKPAGPIPAPHNLTIFEVTCERYRLVADGGIAR
jgi:hypothetical protein